MILVSKYLYIYVLNAIFDMKIYSIILIVCFELLLLTHFWPCQLTRKLPLFPVLAQLQTESVN